MGKAAVFLCALGTACVSWATVATGQTALSPGDLAFSGYGSSGTDQFSFVLARDVVAGTSITFTDRGWLEAGGFRPGEGTFELTMGADYACGAEFVAVMSPLGVFDANGLPAGTTVGGGLQLSTSGDQVFAYQGPEPTSVSEVGLLAGVQMNGDWDADASSTNTSTQPSSLFGGVHSVAIAAETNNARYDCSVVAAPASLLSVAIHDEASWLRDDAAPFELSLTCGFSCASACTAPDVPILAGDTVILAGESTTLSIDTGSLGDATQWQWYVDGCGVTSVGNGASLPVMPSGTLQLFVRGEGGCVTGGACGTVTVTVEPLPPAPQTKGQQRCLNAMMGQLAVVAGIQGKEALKCAKGYAKAKVGSAESCVRDDTAGKVAKARSKVTDLAAKKCVESPDFGFGGDTILADAAVSAATGAFSDLFQVAFDGTILPDAADRSASLCQLAIAGSAQKCLAARLKEFGRCVKKGLKDGSITSAAGLAACMGMDPKGKIASACDLGTAGDKKVDGVRRSLGKRCLAAEVVPSTVLPACPAGSDVESAHGCLTPRLACRACLAADSVAGLGVSCDDLDDGQPNGSCVG